MFAKTAVKDEKVVSDATILRQAIIAEQDAINLYEQMSRTTKNSQLKKLLIDIAKEEKVHIGEFEALLMKVDKDHKSSMEKGHEEAKKLLGFSEWVELREGQKTRSQQVFDPNSIYNQAIRKRDAGKPLSKKEEKMINRVDKRVIYPRKGKR
jgi:rubrerythrin